MKSSTISTKLKGGVKYNAPAEYNSAEFTNQKHLIFNIDWLSFRIVDTLSIELFDDKILNLRGGYKLILQEYGTPQFINLCFVHYEGEKIAEIQFNARMAALKGSAIVKIENHVFYSAFYRGFNEIFTTNLIDILNSKMLNVSRLDICVDGVEFDRFINDLRVEKKYYQLKQKNVKGVDNGYNSEFGGVFTGFYVGNRNGRRFGRYYNKTKELKKKGHKKYISEYFVSNGFDVNKDIKRFEIQMNSEFLGEVKDFDLSRILSKNDELVRLFELSLSNFFEFVSAESNDTNISRRKRIKLFDFSNVKVPTYVRVKKEKGSNIRTKKIVVKNLIFEALTDKEKTMIDKFHTAKKIVDDYDLGDWLISKSEYIVNEVWRYCEINNIEMINIETKNLFNLLSDYKDIEI